eukprot:m51a1_g8796 hypothetical protein (511) ;mRNA; f:243178-245292
MAEVSQASNRAIVEQLSALHPEAASVWRHFVSLCEVPHCSGHTAAASRWAEAAGRSLGGDVRADAAGNVSIRFPATPGCEKAPGVVLQAHLDMVGTKLEDLHFDFAKDTISIEVEGDRIRAKGTTLGADDGSGVAVALALAGDKSAAHGPLEILFTVDEEIGMIGANHLGEGMITAGAKYLVNVDSEEFGELTVSCAGSAKREIRIPVPRAPHAASGWTHYAMKLKDLKGGHSGLQIHVGRANAIKWAAHILLDNKATLTGTQFRLSAFSGGNAHNAIPSACSAELAVPSGSADAFLAEARATFAALYERWSHVEGTPVLEFTRIDAPTTADALTATASRTALRFVESIHHGVWAWSEDCPGLVETSQSLSRAGLAGTEFWAEIYARSAKTESTARMSVVADSIAALYNGRVVRNSADAPGWPADPSSRLCVAAQRVFKEQFGRELSVAPCHAGLECGIILNKYPENHLQAISVGPNLRNPHTTNEFMELSSCVKLLQYLKALLADLSKP